MPKNKLYKYCCKEHLCGNIIRSDKWNEHCQKKHAVKFKEGTECKKEILSVQEDGQSEWKKFVADEHSKKEPEMNT